ncbi:MAG: class I SAM-dependent methyltransferase [Planctomycetaceae bacterium]
MNSTPCPLCSSGDTQHIYTDACRPYRQCSVCRLVFVPKEHHLSADDEKRHYDQHENSPEDVAYRRFLNRLFEPLQRRLADGSSGLDYGSGPGPTLSVMLSEVGHRVRIYDPYYAPDRGPLSAAYDFVTASEVVEHFCRPADDLAVMWNCVKTGGLLGIMTRQTPDLTAFPQWHYKNDPTHVSFFARETFEWLAARWGANLQLESSDVVIFQKV